MNIKFDMNHKPIRSQHQLYSHKCQLQESRENLWNNASYATWRPKNRYAERNSETNKSLSSKILLNQPKIINNTNYNTKRYQSTFIINDFIDFSRMEQLRKNGLKGRLNDKSKSNFIDLIPNQNKVSIKASN